MYGRKCNAPISWSNPVDRLVLGPELLKDVELIVKQVQENLKVAQSRQKFKKILNELRKTSRWANMFS